MTPDPVTRLNAALEGRYAIERELGEGGMATVYLADDVKHERKVALKVLKPELAAVVGAERFLAEIKTTANLQHPHILPLFDSGEADSFLFYVMPYVEGETLQDRIDREKQLPLDEAVRIASAVANALQTAHEQGIIHRDIKPANILLSRGEPLIADFGIALAVGAAGGSRLTETGLSVGTPYYMSPEQATGDQHVGPSTDTYALGAVLYEMLTGDPPYMGSTAQAVLGQIISGEAVTATKKRASVPANVDAALRCALEKLPADRFTSAQEFVRALGDPAFRYGDETAVGATSGGHWKRLAIATTMAATTFGVVALLSVGWALSRSGGSSGSVVRSYLELPPNARIAQNPHLALSADGGTAVVGAVVDGQLQLLQRRLGELDFHTIPGTDPGLSPAISPDGQSVAFGNGSGLQKVSLAGGPVIELTSVDPFGAAHWATDGVMYYTPSLTSGVWGVSSDGGAPFQITAPDSVSRELGHWHPQLLPDGEHVIFTAYRTPVDSARIMAVSLSTREVTLVQAGAFDARYSPSGHLLFARGTVLYAAPFDVESVATTGSAVPVIDGIAIQNADGLAHYAVSDNGTLLYAAAADLNVPRQLVTIDRTTNEETELPLPPGLYANPALSPSGGSLALAFEQQSGSVSYVVTVDLTQGRSAPLAQGLGVRMIPLWEPGGERVVYVCELLAYDLCAQTPNSNESETTLVRSGFDKIPYSFSSDGSRLFMLERTSGGGRFLSLSLADPTVPPDTIAAGQGEFLSSGDVSPDGRWIAYVSAETQEMWIESLDPSVPRRWSVPSDDGITPLWTKGGQELVYRGRGERGVFAVPIDPVSGEPGLPRLLFDDTYFMGNNSGNRQWDVTPDGQQFIMIKEPEDRLPRRYVLVQNFFEELRERVPN